MKDLYLIGNAHIDPVWLWRKGEGMAEVLSTFRSALDRMNEFEDYVFTCACAYYYDYVAKVDPDMLSEIRARVREGRWVVVGGMWVQPDMNMPGAEAFARQELYSQRRLKALLGVMARTGYCVDSFGHNGMTPQLLRRGRMENYVFMRPGAHENAALSDLFTWRAPDGSEVMAYRIPLSYADGEFAPADRPELKGKSSVEVKAALEGARADATGCPQMLFYGVGNHGGGPTIRELTRADALLKAHGEMRYSGADALFDDARAQLARAGSLSAGKSGAQYSLPTWTHDLQHHASGCYTANVRIKQLNRLAETMLNEAERYSTLAQALVSAPDVRSRIEAAWEKVMFNQFHDVLAGCTIRSAAQDAKYAFSAAIDEAVDMRMFALERIARRINTIPGWASAGPAQKHGWLLWQGDAEAADATQPGELPPGVGAPVIIFNPHSFPLRARVALAALAGCVRDARGEIVPMQATRGEQTNGDDKFVSLISAELPALGYATYFMYADDCAAPEPKNPARATRAQAPDGRELIALSNGILCANLDARTGLIDALTDLRSGAIIARSAAQAILIDDSACDTWAHGVFKFDKLAGEFTATRVDIVAAGPLRAQVRVISEFNASVLEQTFTLDADSDALNCHVKLTLNDKLRLIKLRFPVGFAPERAYSTMPGGFIEKARDGREQPCHKWIALSDGKRGLAVLNTGRYGAAFEGGEMRLAIARSAISADHYGKRDDMVQYLDIGETEFDYALTPFDDAQIELTDAAAEALGAAPHALMEGQHTGALPETYRGISISAPNVRLQALKRAENGRGYVARLCETAGRACRSAISIAPLNAEFEAEFAPMAINTYFIADGKATLTDFIEPE